MLVITKPCSSFAFGDGLNCPGSDVSHLHFTGQYWEEDNAGESNLTRTANRLLSTTQGRWLTPDPAGMAAVDVTNPQTWNRYAYVTNNPLSLTDPTGLAPPGLCPVQGLPVCQGGYFNGLSLLLSFANGSPANWDSLAIWSYTTDVIKGWVITGNCDNCKIPLTEQQTSYYVSVAGGSSPCTFLVANPCGGGGGGAANNGPDPGAVLNSMKQYVKAQISNCYNGFHQTTGGKVVQAFSALALFPVASNYQSNQLATGAEVVGKVSVVLGSNSAGGVFAPLLESFTSNVTTPLVVLGTGADAGAYLLCAAGAATSIHP